MRFSSPAQLKAFVKGKRVAVIGLGISNLPAAEYFLAAGALVSARDRRDPASLEADGIPQRLKGAQIVGGDGYLDGLEGFDLILHSPGIRRDLPALQKAAVAGALVTGEMDLFLQMFHGRTVAVTGSSGKTTTTSLIRELLRAQGIPCVCGGNIGTPLMTQVESLSQDTVAVLELSSFQLFALETSPDVAVITNISPNHLDWHKDMAEYAESKANIFLHGGKEHLLCLNADDPYSRDYAARAPGRVRWFSDVNRPENGVFLENGTFFEAENGVARPFMERRRLALPGKYNAQNFMAAFCAVGELVQPETMLRVAEEFQGVEHRCETVRCLRQVRYVNSSIDSSPARTLATVSLFPQTPLVMILGGKPKGIPFDELAKPILKQARGVVLLGPMGPALRQLLESAPCEGTRPPIVQTDTMEQAVAAAAKMARPGDAVLLSPAFTSFDLFRNFEERGHAFKNAVMALQ
ncbi:MAG: UDP-N-acetylmuramoyl-L-alanine--D-glutamate ligase [Clostridia bacterium]|nr:UDP-N-acetylmuramoyl-L-alanine--D-glutamate ligase [Clostridia bacterium]